MINHFTAVALMMSAFASSPIQQQDPAERAKRLKAFLEKEKPKFTQRESEKNNLLEELDRLNAHQNRFRDRIVMLQVTLQELGMATDNLSVELKNQKGLEELEKRRLVLLMKFVYQIKKDGLLQFLVSGEDLASLAARLRVLYRTLGSQTQIAHQLKERAERLAESERRVSLAKEDSQKALGELHEHEALLQQFLRKKRQVLASVMQKQGAYEAALRDYKLVSTRLSSLFENFESQREPHQQIYPDRKSLPLPVVSGKVVKNYGRLVHQRFGTITYQKGIEIEAKQNTPVTAILPGVVEFEGWVKGLGNVVIIHHGGGFYSLSAHLFRAVQSKGTRVQQGDVIGLVGDTGNNVRPSLYFEIRENGKAVDPLVYFSSTAVANLRAG